MELSLDRWGKGMQLKCLTVVHQDIPLVVLNLVIVTTWLGYEIFFNDTNEVLNLSESFSWHIKLFNVLENSNQT